MGRSAGSTGPQGPSFRERADVRQTCPGTVSRVVDRIALTRVSARALPTDTPSSPSIDQVEPYSSTAQVQFDEPEATGGVPILKYKAEWRALGEEVWHSKWYDAKEGERRLARHSTSGAHSPAVSTRSWHPDCPRGRAAPRSHLLGEAGRHHPPSCSCSCAAALSPSPPELGHSHISGRGGRPSGPGTSEPGSHDPTGMEGPPRPPARQKAC